MKLKLKNNIIIPLDDFFMHGFCGYTHVNDMEEYQELLTKLTPEALEDVAVFKEDDSLLLELTNARLSSTQATYLYNGTETQVYVSIWLEGDLYDETKEIMKIINGEE